MNFSTFANPFIPLIKTNKLTSTERNYELILLSLYEELLEGDKQVKILSKDKESVVDIHLTNNSKFFPKAIRTYIKNTPVSLYEFNSQVKGREIILKFYLFNETVIKPAELAKYAHRMLTWLQVCAKYADKKCAQEMVIQVYLTPFKKTLPDEASIVLAPEHVNTAFTMSCAPDGEIIIYREEEWFKVFLHESFHAYGLDFGLHEPRHLTQVLKQTFLIKSEFNANEAYTETWARIINCALYSFFSLKKKNNSVINQENFLLYMNFCLQLERLFAIYQMNKVLQFMGLNYTDLYETNERSGYLRQQLYKENTHVFGYYILTAIFLNDSAQFIGWCHANNNAEQRPAGFMKFNCTEQSFKNIGEYISGMYKNTGLLKTIEACKTLKLTPVKKYKDLINTTRMTVVDNIYA